MHRPLEHHHNISLIGIAGTRRVGDGTKQQQLRAVEIAPDTDAVLRYFGDQNRGSGDGQQGDGEEGEQTRETGVERYHSGCTV